MKNLLIIILSVSFCALSFSLHSQNKALKISAGINSSDVNGDEFSQYFLPRQDYLSYSNAGNSDQGFYLNIGNSFNVSDHISLSASVGYHELHYKIESSVSNLAVLRPTDPSIPVALNGSAKHSFLNLQAGVDYSFNQTPNKGLLVSLSFSNMLYLNTKRNATITYEDLKTMSKKNIEKHENEPEYNNFWFAGIGLAYNIPLTETVSLAPSIAFKYGLNSMVDNSLESNSLEGGITFQWRY